MAEVKSNQTKRPHDTAFRQQRLKAWQPILTPRWVIGTFFCVGLIFIPVGIGLTSLSNEIYEQSIVYDGPNLVETSCHISENNEGYVAVQNNEEKDCSVTFEIDRDIDPDTPLNLYYSLTQFYQNHRRYVKSRSDTQLLDQQITITDGGNAALRTECEPDQSYQDEESGKIFWPCGLIATSYFNEGILLDSYSGEDDDGKVALDKTNVAWSSDLNSKFLNPTGANSNNYDDYIYIWQLYDQMSCYSIATGNRVACETWEDVVGKPVEGNGCARCPPGSRYEYQGGIPPPGGAENFDPTTPATNSRTDFGVRDQNFIVWMRTAGLPDFRKLYATVTPPENGFKKGDQLTFRIIPNFEVASYGGTKGLVLSTVNALGGKNNVLGIAYIAVGAVCWFLALAFGIKHKVSPRKLGDTKYLVWTKRQ